MIEVLVQTFDYAGISSIEARAVTCHAKDPGERIWNGMVLEGNWRRPHHLILWIEDRSIAPAFAAWYPF